jgi:hypothetical protein
LTLLGRETVPVGSHLIPTQPNPEQCNLRGYSLAP